MAFDPMFIPATVSAVGDLVPDTPSAPELLRGLPSGSPTFIEGIKITSGGSASSDGVSPVGGFGAGGGGGVNAGSDLAERVMIGVVVALISGGIVALMVKGK